MSMQLPVKMLPITPAAAKPAGFVIAVLIGLALFSRNQRSAASSQQSNLR